MIRLLDQMTHHDWPFMNRSFAEALVVRESSRDKVGAILAEKVYLGTSWIPAPGASSALAQLVAHGFGAAIVSNTVHGDIAHMLSKTQLCSVDCDYTPVAAIVDSQVVGVGKPDPRPFVLALGALGQSPEHCVHVGDSLQNDVVGAIGVGMTPIHMDPLSLCDDDTHGHFNSFEAFVADLIP